MLNTNFSSTSEKIAVLSCTVKSRLVEIIIYAYVFIGMYRFRVGFGSICAACCGNCPSKIACLLFAPVCCRSVRFEANFSSTYNIMLNMNVNTCLAFLSMVEGRRGPNMNISDSSMVERSPEHLT